MNLWVEVFSEPLSRNWMLNYKIFIAPYKSAHNPYTPTLDRDTTDISDGDKDESRAAHYSVVFACQGILRPGCC